MCLCNMLAFFPAGFLVDPCTSIFSSQTCLLSLSTVPRKLLLLSKEESVDNVSFSAWIAQSQNGKACFFDRNSQFKTFLKLLSKLN